MTDSSSGERKPVSIARRIWNAIKWGAWACVVAGLGCVIWFCAYLCFQIVVLPAVRGPIVLRAVTELAGGPISNALVLSPDARKWIDTHKWATPGECQVGMHMVDRAEVRCKDGSDALFFFRPLHSWGLGFENPWQPLTLYSASIGNEYWFDKPVAELALEVTGDRPPSLVTVTAAQRVGLAGRSWAKPGSCTFVRDRSWVQTKGIICCGGTLPVTIRFRDEWNESPADFTPGVRPRFTFLSATENEENSCNEPD